MKPLTIFFCISLFGVAQSSNQLLNRDINAMKSAFIQKDFDTFVNYLYPKTFEITGGKANTVMMMKMMYNKMGNDIAITSVNYKNPGKTIKYKNEIQITLEEETAIKTAKGTITNENTLIAISNNNGKNWTFINTLNQPKEELLKKFPNLSPDLVLKSKVVNKKQ